jgi:hypothetical protein
VPLEWDDPDDTLEVDSVSFRIAVKTTRFAGEHEVLRIAPAIRFATEFGRYRPAD